jgi:hypothetical protein
VCHELHTYVTGSSDLLSYHEAACYYEYLKVVLETWDYKDESEYDSLIRQICEDLIKRYEESK